MALTRIWTPRAIQSYREVLSYIDHKFGERVAKRYADQIEKTTMALADFPNLGTLQFPKKNIRGLVVKKHTTLLYTTSADHLILLHVFDNRLNPQKKRF